MSALSKLPPHDRAAIANAPREHLPRDDEESWNENDVVFAWCVAHKRPFLPLNERHVHARAYAEFWRHCAGHAWLPLHLSDDVAMCISPRVFSPNTRREVAKILRCEVYWAGCTSEDFDRTLASLGEPEKHTALPPPVHVPPAWKLIPKAGASDPYRGWVIEVLECAQGLGASDVFLDDESNRLSVRFRLSGWAEVFPPIPKLKRAQFLGALKRMAGINPNERYAFHDAKFALDLPNGEAIEVRCAFAPSQTGETIALRLQNSKRMVKSGLKIPLPSGMLGDYLAALQRKSGMVLLTGPTGSGKTTTLYASLLSLDLADLVVRTIEDPIEITIPGVSQTAVGGTTGRSFAQALRSFLRLNPDVILCGEIRDKETAGLAIEAALTGHLLLSTLHAMDTVETITRLIDLFPDRDMRGPLASTLSAVISQRLAPRLCQKCKEERPLEPAEDLLYRRYHLEPPSKVYRRYGCPECGNGFRGREPIFEALFMTPALRDVITEGDHFHSDLFRRTWMRAGGKPLGCHALELAAGGLITLEEAKAHQVWVPAE